jgi:hypothetical protein
MGYARFSVKIKPNQTKPLVLAEAQCCWKIGLLTIKIVTATRWQLVYGFPADVVNKFIRIGKRTAIESLPPHCQSVVCIFRDQFLQAPYVQDMERIYKGNGQLRFTGMLLSPDCMHWRWKNCPIAWKGQFTGKEEEATIVLKNVATYDLWIWDAFFGMRELHNDINVLGRSTLFADLAKGYTLPINFHIYRHDYTMGYYLADS